VQRAPWLFLNFSARHPEPHRSGGVNSQPKFAEAFGAVSRRIVNVTVGPNGVCYHPGHSRG
jgi:hypothetical protein